MDLTTRLSGVVTGLFAALTADLFAASLTVSSGQVIDVEGFGIIVLDAADFFCCDFQQ